MKKSDNNSHASIFFISVVLLFSGMQVAYANDGNALKIETGFLKDPMYVLSTQKTGKLNDGLSFSAEFEKVLSLHPDALAAAKKANGFRPVVIGGQLVLLGGTVVMLLETLKEADDPLGAQPSYGLSLGLIIAGAVISIIGSSAFKSNLNKAVNIFNENEKKDPKLSINGMFDINRIKQQAPKFAMDIKIDRSASFTNTVPNNKANNDLNVLANLQYRF